MTDVNHLVAYYKGEATLDEIVKPTPNSGTAIEGSRDTDKGSALCLVLPGGVHWFSSSSSPFWFRVIAFSCFEANDCVAGIELSFKRGCWEVKPTVVDLWDYRFHRDIVTLTDAWMEVLCRLASKILQPLFHFRPQTRWVRDGIKKEAGNRCNLLVRQGPLAFFMNPADAVAWYVASCWSRWEEHDVPNETWGEEIGSALQLAVPTVELVKLRPSTVLARLRRGKSAVDRMRGWNVLSSGAGGKVGSSVSNKAVVQRTGTLSKGGHPQAFHAFKLEGRMFPQTSAVKSIADLEKCGIWWWRLLAKADDAKLQDRFNKNWEKSAYFYELRARLTDENEVPAWDGFGRSWIDLDQSQRGALYYLWPPPREAIASKTVRRGDALLLHKKYSANIFMVRPLKEVLEDVRAQWMEMEPELTHLLGVSGGPESKPKSKGRDIEGKGRGESLALKSGSIPPKWILLEELDCLRYLGAEHFKLNNHSHLVLTRVLASYQAACESAGILSLLEKSWISKYIKR